MIVIDGHITVAALKCSTGNSDELIPDGRAFAVLVPAPFNLIGGRRCAPKKVSRKYVLGHALCLHIFFDRLAIAYILSHVDVDAHEVLTPTMSTKSGMKSGIDTRECQE